MSVGERSEAGASEQGLAVLERLRDRPGGAELLALARERGDIALVGGAVRDLLLGGITPRELDVTVERDAAALAAELATRLPGNDARPPQVTEHERFGTAVVEWIHGRIDIAERRTEAYARPGALPEVRPGTPAEDLARRDFTVNAIAVSLGGRRRGEITAVDHALADLAAGRLRTLHERSFLDDPTRLLRLGRYSARLGFEVEPQTARAAAQALSAGALDTVSGARIAAELWLVTEEGTPAAFSSLAELGVLAALSLPGASDEELLVQASALLPSDGIADVLQMALLFHPGKDSHGSEQRLHAAALMERFEFFAETRERVLAAAFDSTALAVAIGRAQRPSQLRRALGEAPVEAIAIAAAIGGRLSPEIPNRARAWLEELRDVKLEIGGADLIAAGMREGPEIGRRLAAVLDRKLDGEIDGGREGELAAALQTADDGPARDE